ncbi:ring-cleaving dioxygenase [Muricauda oceani]|uniref:Ring-cleaving dioxygenase n=1 Tax=Flagellimonas oceani TaxID=2698672 RepID=A0A6G7IZW5_9FLAO|nr:ring-cleaving dioxygenase [Allomuricauda oceani]MBW8244800.1 ring-cleaving dioxygenase [Allomuricauda oceani]QII43888.1 ring-cleaving dioxygenase [Allomuricauda oceani]
MKKEILGLHHITAIAGDAQNNYKFYTEVLGLRFIKKTVNFDDPGTYHFYFGDKVGNAGTILTFFPWGNNIPTGRRGSGMATEIGYSVPVGSLEFWMDRFEKHNVIYNKPAQKFNQQYLSFLDPDGLKFELFETENDQRTPWTTEGISAEHATRGFHNITLTLNDIQGTAEVLTSIFGYELHSQESNRYRYVTRTVPNAALVELVEIPTEKRGHVANGTVHHVAFRVKNDETLLHFREKIEKAGLNITPPIDRNYFHSLYFREPGGVLFEIATDNPGFTVDESEENLGMGLKLPEKHEHLRRMLEEKLVKIN